MRRGKSPPFKVRLQLSRAQKTGNAVFGRGTNRASISEGTRAWFERNCLQCAHRNFGKLTEAKLLGEDFSGWKHICCFPGVTKLKVQTERKPEPNCTAWVSVQEWLAKESDKLP